MKKDTKPAPPPPARHKYEAARKNSGAIPWKELLSNHKRSPKENATVTDYYYLYTY